MVGPPRISYLLAIVGTRYRAVFVNRMVQTLEGQRGVPSVESRFALRSVLDHHCEANDSCLFLRQLFELPLCAALRAAELITKIAPRIMA